MLKKISGKVRQNRSDEELRVIVHVVKLYGKDVYIKVTEKSLTMSGTTVRDHWITYQLAWLVAQETGVANLLLRLVGKHVGLNI